MESSESILSLDTVNLDPQDDEPFSTLIEKEPDTNYIWTTDEEGFFYILEELHSPEDQTYIYALKQVQADGTNPKYTIERAFFQRNRDFIDHYRENGDRYPEFTNSPQSTQSIGEITSFKVNQESNGVYISTDISTYWYDISRNRYRLICAYPADFISFSPNSKRVLFSNGNNFYVFTLEKEEGDHTEKIGTEKVAGIRKDDVDNIHWLSNSTHLYYTMDDFLYISERDGGNRFDILEIDNVILHNIKDNREHIVTLEIGQEDVPLLINQYKIK